MGNKTLEYLKTQTLRMSEEQVRFVKAILNLPQDAIISKADEKIMVNLYVWLHQTDGDISDKRIFFLKPTKKSHRTKAQKRRSKSKFYLSR